MLVATDKSITEADKLAHKQDQELERARVVQAFKCMAPGMFADIEINSTPNLRFKAKLIGFNEGKYLIFAVPITMLSQYRDKFVDGVGAVIRTIVEGHAGQCVAFRTSIQLVAARPKGLVFFKYPASVECLSLRKESRVSVVMPVSIMRRNKEDHDGLFHNEAELSGKIIDISSGGCRVAIQWEQGKPKILKVPVFLSITMPGKKDAHILKAEIKSLHREDPLSISLGLMFVQNDELKVLLADIGVVG